MENSRRKKFLLVFSITAAGCLIAAVLSLCLGAASVSFGEIFTDSTVSHRIIFLVRVPRTAACLLAGAGLAVSGALIQGVLANSLASPGIIGVNAGAGLGVTICFALGAVSGWAAAVSAFAGALTAVLTVAITARKVSASRSAVILGGVAVNSFLAAISEAITTLFPDIASLSADFKTGGFSGVSAARIIPAGIMIIAALVISLSLSNELDLLSMGEDAAQGLGLSVKKIRSVFLVLAAVLAGASVSFAGLLGFVGLIIPNMVKRVVGSESRHVLPICAAGGAAFVTLCDCAARTVFSPYEIPTGIIMSAVGAPFFIYLLFRRKGGHSHG